MCDGAHAVVFLDAISATYYQGVWPKDSLWKALTSEVAAALPAQPAGAFLPWIPWRT